MTWLLCVYDFSNGFYTKPSTVPDSITTWIATAFSVHPETGLDVVDQPFEVCMVETS